VLNSSYLIRLQQYGSDGTAYYNGEGFDNTGLPNQFSEGNLLSLVDNQIVQGNVPPPGGIDPIYVVVTPPGITSDQPGDGGYHTTLFSVVFGNLHVAWVSTSANQNGTINLDGFAPKFGHEVVESITDPVLLSGITTPPGASFPDPPPDSSEIGDYEAQRDMYRIGGPSGVLVQSYWSQQDKGLAGQAILL
jgi:hypothetical protein